MKAAFVVGYLSVLSIVAGCGSNSTELVVRPPEELSLPLEPTLEQQWQLSPAFPGLSFDDPLFMGPVPGTSLLLVAEREGRLWVFENEPTVSTKQLVLDISATTQGEGDTGLMGFALHPEFGQPDSPNRGYLYAHYAHHPSPEPGVFPPDLLVTSSRLSRFTVDLETWTIDPSSEQLLIDQQDESTWHQGGALFFHPEDGFLYLALGDEGQDSCFFDNCQRIDKDLFAGVLRIDVDQQGGDVSHPVVRQPQTGSTGNYYIPNDNPFVGEPGVLEEFYALGLRSPHRMTYDAVDNVVFVGEVGQFGRDEIDVLRKGANYQWPRREGTWRFGPGPYGPTEDTLGDWTGPLVDFDRAESRTLIGGYVYRGSRLPQLRGRYLFSDFYYGRVWAMDYHLDGDQVVYEGFERLLDSQFLNRENGVTSLAMDAQGEVYVLVLGEESQVQRIVHSPSTDAAQATNMPLTLSQTGIFSDMDRREPNTALVPYLVQAPLYSDGAVKTRFMALRSQTPAVGQRDGAWSFPPGTVFVKHFELAFDERRPEELSPIETRVLLGKPEGGYFGATYRWRADGEEADLLTDSLTVSVSRIDSAGNPYQQPYLLPGPNECNTCHNSAAGLILGVHSSQLNGPGTYVDNQLEYWSSQGLVQLADPPNDFAAQWPQLRGLTDPDAPLESKVRSYLDSNCSMCHGSLEGLRARWDARFETPLSEQGLVGVDSLQGAGALIAPGSPEASYLWQRVNTTDPSLSMPPLGRHRVDEEFVSVLSEWIAQL